MKIGQIILKGVNNFKDFRFCFEDGWTHTIPDSLLLLGPNGCGKTTLLRAIGNLWSIFGGFLERLPYLVLTNGFIEPGRYDGTFRVGDPPHSLIIQSSNIFSECHLAAMEIQDLWSDPPTPLWVYIGEDHEVSVFLQSVKEAHKVGGVRLQDSDRNLFRLEYLAPGMVETDTSNSVHQWIERMQDRFLKNRMGGDRDLANLVFLESESRTFLQIEEDYKVVPEKETFNWLALYTPTSRREGNLQNYLFTLKAIHEKRYEEIVSTMNTFLRDKQIRGFDKQTAELMITTSTGSKHPVHLLSSGEKQILLILAFLARELRPGGIVLIDEPDLHLHGSLSTAFVHHLKQWIADQGGQVIMASHSPQLWEHFTQAERVELGSLEEMA